jgi:hypothetical protein
LVQRVRLLALQSANMRMDEPHLRQRMQQRGISMRQMLEVLAEGEAIDGPRLDQYGDWRIKLARKVAGRRVQVVVAVAETYFVPITVI